MISVAKSFGVDAQVIGRVEESGEKELVIDVKGKHWFIKSLYGRSSKVAIAVF